MTQRDPTAPVLYEKRGQVAYVTLNRPAVLNALNLAVHAQLETIWSDYENDDALRVCVLRGAGSKAFSVGQDLKELVVRRADGVAPSSFGSRGLPGWPRLTERFEMTKPVIAAVRGHALGGGFELALACDIIVASDDSRFALPEARLGLIAGAGGVFRLSRQLPLKTAMGHLLTGRALSAQRAYELGLLNDVVAPEQLDACVGAWVDDILRCAPLSVRAIKEVVGKSQSMSLEQAFDQQYAWEEKRKASADCEEGPRAFTEKRLPRWINA